MMKETFAISLENEEIVFADITTREDLEVILVCKSRNIFLIDLKSGKVFHFNSLSFDPTHLNLQMHSFENYVCISQRNGLEGMIIDLTDSKFQKNLHRIDYQAEHCLFPIAFYKKENHVFLIHGTEWNRLDITCLDTDELLTSRIVDYETNSNYFDYFHSSILVSPDAKHFTSNGWVWQPYDVITVYSIDRFLKEFELSNMALNFEPVDGYNWDRPLCWIDNKTLGIGYNKNEERESKEDFPSQIIFVDIIENQMIDRIEFDGFGLSEYGAAEGELFFDSTKSQFIGLNKKSGLLISDMKGKVLYEDRSLRSHKYSIKHGVFYAIDNRSQTLELTTVEFSGQFE